MPPTSATAIASVTNFVLGLISRTSSRVNSRRNTFASSRRAVAADSIAAASINGATCVCVAGGITAGSARTGKKCSSRSEPSTRISSPSSISMPGSSGSLFQNNRQFEQHRIAGVVRQTRRTKPQIAAFSGADANVLVGEDFGVTVFARGNVDNEASCHKLLKPEPLDASFYNELA